LPGLAEQYEAGFSRKREARFFLARRLALLVGDDHGLPAYGVENMFGRQNARTFFQHPHGDHASAIRADGRSVVRFGGHRRSRTHWSGAQRTARSLRNVRAKWWRTHRS